MSARQPEICAALIMLQNFLFQIHSVNLKSLLKGEKKAEKRCTVSTEILSSIMVMIISIYKLFMNNHVMLKTGVMAAENSALASQEHITF